MALVLESMKLSAIATALILCCGGPAGTALLAEGTDEKTAATAPIGRFAQLDAQLYRGAQPDDAGYRIARQGWPEQRLR